MYTTPNASKNSFFTEREVFSDLRRVVLLITLVVVIEISILKRVQRGRERERVLYLKSARIKVVRQEVHVFENFCSFLEVFFLEADGV
tara:strand:- start:243 stop:506 length:264 start_codon:yes stop_codon:yes gene_type:complete